jgi:hypothetical protein
VDKLENVHPGEVLLEEFLVPMGLSHNRTARAIGVPRGASTRSFMASGLLPPIPPYDWPAILEPLRPSGWASRQTLTSKRPAANSENDWKPR